MRYMPLSPAARHDAIALLNARPEAGAHDFGDIVETAVTASPSIR
jgi:hypothetical protein